MLYVPSMATLLLMNSLPKRFRNLRTGSARKQLVRRLREARERWLSNIMQFGIIPGDWLTSIIPSYFKEKGKWCTSCKRDITLNSTVGAAQSFAHVLSKTKSTSLSETCQLKNWVHKYCNITSTKKKGCLISSEHYFQRCSTRSTHNRHCFFKGFHWFWLYWRCDSWVWDARDRAPCTSFRLCHTRNKRSASLCEINWSKSKIAQWCRVDRILCRVPTGPWKSLNLFIHFPRPWKSLKTQRSLNIFLESSWISVNGSLKILKSILLYELLFQQTTDVAMQTKCEKMAYFLAYYISNVLYFIFYLVYRRSAVLFPVAYSELGQCPPPTRCPKIIGI